MKRNLKVASVVLFLFSAVAMTGCATTGDKMMHDSMSDTGGSMQKEMKNDGMMDKDMKGSEMNDTMK
ncbi:MAG: hypothetical protein C0623_02850 [Desulfuromonas sp.]|nr:MAG: hypothetical protein C0623_02850 [Desulfuromonas sp.]